jgi:hypothetical protein
LNTVGLHHDWKERKKTKETDEKWRSRTKIFFAASSRFFVPDKKKTEFFFASVAHFFAQRFKAEPAKRRQLFEASENDEPAIFFHSRKVIFDEKVLGNFNLVQEFDISTLLRHFFPDQGGRTRQNKTSAPQKWGEKRKILQQLRPERPPDFFFNHRLSIPGKGRWCGARRTLASRCPLPFRRRGCQSGGSQHFMRPVSLFNKSFVCRRRR